MQVSCLAFISEHGWHGDRQSTSQKRFWRQSLIYNKHGRSPCSVQAEMWGHPARVMPGPLLPEFLRLSRM